MGIEAIHGKTLSQRAGRPRLTRTSTKRDEKTAMRKQTSAFRSYYKVPYAEREAAKAMGARWDAEHKLWYAGTFETSSAMAERWEPVYVPGPRDALYAAREAKRRYWRMSAYI